MLNNSNNSCLQLASTEFHLEISSETGGVRALRHGTDRFSTNFALDPTTIPDFNVPESCWLGDVILGVRSASGVRRMSSNVSRDIISVGSTGSRHAVVTFSGTASNPCGFSGIKVVVSYELQDNRLVWTAAITNTSSEAIEVEDLGFPLMMNSFWSDTQKGIYEDCVSRHSFTGLGGSYIYWQRPNGVGPFLVMVPNDGTHLEFKNKLRDGEGPYGALGAKWEGLVEYYVHSRNVSKERRHQSGTYLPASSHHLASGESRAYSFSFAWADSYSHMRDVLVELGSLDVISMPGMVVPVNTKVVLALRSRGGIEKIVCGSDVDHHRSRVRHGYDLFEVTIRRTGRQNITVTFNGTRTSVLQYYGIEAIESLIDKRAAFLSSNQQAKTPRGYDGAFLQWDMLSKRLITWENCPDAEGCWKEWMAGGSDDLGLAPAAFLSEKTLLNPNQEEIESIDYYITHFLFGYLQNATKDGQRTFQVYRWFDGQDGSPSDLGVWRSYNYPHIANTYLNMYLASKAFRCYRFQYLPIDYLTFCYKTLVAMFTKIPMPTPIGDAAKTLGQMGESTFPDVLGALRDEGMTTQCKLLEGYIREKYQHFRSETYPFASEQTIDTTGFESTYTLGKLFGDDNLVHKTQSASLACRGVQPAWYHFGSDNRLMGESWWNLGYETQLGAWQQQDYLVTFLPAASLNECAEQIRSTHGAYLAGWANINTGQIDADPHNVGAAAWLFQSEKGENEWSWMGIRDGWWMWSGEADLGFWGGLRTGAVNVVDDPIVGLYAYSGDLSVDDSGSIAIIPQDGVRNQLNIFILGKISLKLRYLRYSKATINIETRVIVLDLEDISRGVSSGIILLRNLPTETFVVSLPSTEWRREVKGGQDLALPLPRLPQGSQHLHISPLA